MGGDHSIRMQHLLALLDGLRVALCRAHDALTPNQARDLFFEACERVVGRQATWLAPYAPWALTHPPLLAGKQGVGSIDQPHLVTPST